MNVLFVRTGGLGDCLLTLPVAYRFKQSRPDAHLHILGNETMLSAASLSGMFVSYHSIDRGDYHNLYSMSKPDERLRCFLSRFDSMYFFTSVPGKRVAGFLEGLGVARCRVLDPRPPADWTGHIVEHLMSILDESDIAMSRITIPKFGCRPDVTRGGFGLLIHPGSGSPGKNWNLSNFIRVAETTPLEPAFLLGPAEIEAGMAGEIDSAGFRVIRADSLKELCRVLGSVVLYLGNDSGVSHLAAFCGTPSVVLFGPTDPAVWRPLGENVTVISSRDGTMDGIGLAEVLDAVETVSR